MRKAAKKRPFRARVAPEAKKRLCALQGSCVFCLKALGLSLSCSVPLSCSRFASVLKACHTPINSGAHAKKGEGTRPDLGLGGAG